MTRGSMAASAPEVAFFVHNTDQSVNINIKTNIAMFKNNNSIVPAAYVSPAVKWVDTRTRGMVCTSPYNQVGQKDWIVGSDDIRDEKEDWGY